MILYRQATLYPLPSFLNFTLNMDFQSNLKLFGKSKEECQLTVRIFSSLNPEKQIKWEDVVEENPETPNKCNPKPLYSVLHKNSVSEFVKKIRDSLQTCLSEVKTINGIHHVELSSLEQNFFAFCTCLRSVKLYSGSKSEIIYETLELFLKDIKVNFKDNLLVQAIISRCLLNRLGIEKKTQSIILTFLGVCEKMNFAVCKKSMEELEWVKQTFF